MKKIIFSLFFFSLMILSAQAQKSTCSKPCTKSSAASAACQAKAPSVATANFQDNSEAAVKLASMDATIEAKKDPATGNMSYVKKETCTHSGHVSYVNVSYDASTNLFVNVSPATTTTGSGCGSKATTASGKSCCAAGAAAGKTCCAGKTASIKTAEKVKS